MGVKRLVLQSCVLPFELGLVEDGTLVCKEAFGFPVSSSLFLSIEKVLTQAGWKPKDLDEICFVSGPGSFTGLRTGYAFVLGLARGLGIRLRTLGLFDIYAASLDRAFVAFKRTQSDAFVADIINGKAQFLKTPMTFVDIQKKLAKLKNIPIYGNVFDGKEVVEESVSFEKVVKAFSQQTENTIGLIYGRTCYAEAVYSKDPAS